MMFKKTLLAAAVFAFGGFVVSAQASTTTTAQFNVSLTVNSTCTVATPSDITLDAVDAGVASADYKSTTINVSCSNGTPFTVGLTPSSSNTDGTGDLTGTAHSGTIAYALYQDGAGSSPWGNTVGNTQSGTGAGMATAVPLVAYAHATGSTDVQPDTYTDLVQVSVSY